MSFEVEEIQVIELKMMDKRKYFPLTLASGLTIRSMLYPFMLIKTRLQIQRGHTVYRGTFDALFKIGANEGVSGLYRGFWVSCLQLFPSMAYISTYEGTRHYLAEHMNIMDNSVRSFIGGGFASLVGQTLAVPLDIVTQHLMLMGRRGEKKPGECVGMLASVTPVYVPRLLLQVVAGPLGGISSALITNPIDVIRARIQVEGTKFGETVDLLWKEEGMWIMTKGLSARLVQSVTFSFFIILGYETIKRWSVLEEYKDRIRW
ncbi:solute carrier family 25 member 44 [Aplysia californica]|uniref:Solute carrier family 25 member 44 n=1 Tax=Aplysia californica TaxID=6500 RepID=A0ABM1AF38_APLCA|nr:solute carrier family 25 member 44 [Aplysia californica]